MFSSMVAVYHLAGQKSTVKMELYLGIDFRFLGLSLPCAAFPAVTVLLLLCY